MKLVHLSDLHLHEEPVGGFDPVARFGQALDHIARHHGDADSVVISGDLTHNGTLASYRTLRDKLDASGLPVRLMLGNHDLRANFRAVFPDHPVDDDAFVQQAFDAGAHRLVLLDSVDETSHAGLLGPRRLGWLAHQLHAARQAGLPVLLFLHHNPAPIGVWASDLLGLEDSDAFRAILREHASTVRHLFFGHTHYSLSGVLDGVPFSAPRATNHPCWPLFDGSHRMGFGPIAPNYNVALFGDGVTTIHTVDFMLEDQIVYLDVPDAHAWVHQGLPTG